MSRTKRSADLVDTQVGALVAYTLYTFTAQTALADGWLMLGTVPFVVYGIFRYLYLIHVQRRTDSPDELLWHDKSLLLSVALWAVAVVTLIYVP